MPSANQYLEEEDHLRIFAYGPAKSRKTWWALKAAEAGFRVLLFDFERGASIVNQVSPEARKRIFIIEANDSPTDAYAIAFAVAALKTHEFYFDEETRRVSPNKAAGLSHCDMRSFGRDTVVVFDSYTSLAVSATRQFAFQNSVDLSDASKTSWEGYRWCGTLLTWLLVQVKQLRCHVIMIGHETHYEKYKKHPTDPNKQGPLEWTRRQPTSVSNPHGMSITQHFTDILYFHVQGRTAKIDARGNKLEEGGGRHVAPEEYTWDDLSFAAIVKAAGMPIPTTVAEFDFPIYAGVQIGGATKSIPVPEKQPAIESGTVETTIQPLSKQRPSFLLNKR